MERCADKNRYRLGWRARGSFVPLVPRTPRSLGGCPSRDPALRGVAKNDLRSRCSLRSENVNFPLDRVEPSQQGTLRERRTGTCSARAKLSEIVRLRSPLLTSLLKKEPPSCQLFASQKPVPLKTGGTSPAISAGEAKRGLRERDRGRGF
jgi:hypothetical protein